MNHCKVSIVTDSASDIPAEIANELHITVIPHFVRFGEEEYLDGVQISPDVFYEKIIARSIPKTSQPNVGAFVEAYRALANTSEAIVSIHNSARMTGVVNSARSACNSVPDAKIEIINSTQVSIGTGLLVIKAAKLALAGEGVESILSVIHSAIPRIYLYAVLDTLEYALRGGRIGKASSLLGRLIKVKPIVRIGDGELLPVGLTRTQRKAMDNIKDNINKLGMIEEASIIHMHAKDTAIAFREMLKDIFPPEKMMIAEAGPAIGTHTGPGSFGIACMISKSYRH